MTTVNRTRAENRLSVQAQANRPGSPASTDPEIDRVDPAFPPHELFPWEYAMKRKPPPDPRHRSWMPEELFPQRCA